jgi:hypothetical protein
MVTERNEGNGKSHEDFLIVNKAIEGYRVYSASRPSLQHLVHLGLSNPACTCDQFGETKNCQHLQAVIEQLTEAERVELDERQAIQCEPATRKKRTVSRTATPILMTLKRSVSPDGRIDSLSVEFSCPLGSNTNGEVKAKAAGMLKLQSEIATRFLGDSATSTNQNNGEKGAPNSVGIPAKMLYVGTFNGRYGPRLFIAIQAKGQALKLFGSAKQLADMLSAAGYQYKEADIAEGIYLNLPCQILTKPSRDGRYTDIARVLPENGALRQSRGLS